MYLQTNKQNSQKKISPSSIICRCRILLLHQKIYRHFEGRTKKLFFSFFFLHIHHSVSMGRFLFFYFCVQSIMIDRWRKQTNKQKLPSYTGKKVQHHFCECEFICRIFFLWTVILVFLPKKKEIFCPKKMFGVFFWFYGWIFVVVYCI